MVHYVFHWLRMMQDTFEEQVLNDAATALYGALPGVWLSSFERTIKHMFPEEIEEVVFLNNRKKKEIEIAFRFADGTIKPYELLSDGYKYVILLAGEIMSRCLLLNQHLDEIAGYETEGVVLIDDFGDCLHYKMQVEVLKRLQTAFPRVQFIVTTRSHLLLEGVDKGQIFVMVEDENGGREIRNLNQEVIGEA